LIRHKKKILSTREISYTNKCAAKGSYTLQTYKVSQRNVHSACTPIKAEVKGELWPGG